jgi:hypothetical protein
MPADHRLRLEDFQSIQYSRSQPIEPGKHEPVNGAEGQPLRSLAPQHVELVSQHQDFGLQCSARPEQSGYGAANQPAEIAHHIDYQPIRGRSSAALGLR